MKKIIIVLAIGIQACSSNKTEFTVNSKCNIFLSGQKVELRPDSDSGRLPEMVKVPEGKIYVSFTGTKGNISCGQSFYNADGGECGGGSTDLNNMGFVAGIIHNSKTMFLTGVFLNDNPSSTALPPRMDASTINSMNEISPLLQQSFYIGDGLDDKKQEQHFIIPKGATRLYLGFADGGSFHGDPSYYSDNKDSVITTVKWH